MGRWVLVPAVPVDPGVYWVPRACTSCGWFSGNPASEPRPGVISLVCYRLRRPFPTALAAAVDLLDLFVYPVQERIALVGRQ